MHIQPIKTKRFSPPQDELLPELFKQLPELPERSILAITAKVVSIDQGRCVPRESIDKDMLIQQEADLFLPRKYTPGEYVMHTITNNTLMPSAGVDGSNADGNYILWPQALDKTLQSYWDMLHKHYTTKEFGIIITDSHSVPLRRGVVGMSLGSVGFQKLHDYRGTKDLFDQELLSSQVNVPDALAAAATFVIGEGDEQTPVALITDLPQVVFAQKQSETRPHSSYVIPIEEDIYKPFLSVAWKKGGNSGTK